MRTVILLLTIIFLTGCVSNHKYKNAYYKGRIDQKKQDIQKHYKPTYRRYKK